MLSQHKHFKGIGTPPNHKRRLLSKCCDFFAFAFALQLFVSASCGAGTVSNVQAAKFYNDTFVAPDPAPTTPYSGSDYHWVAGAGVKRPTAYVSGSYPEVNLWFDLSGFDTEHTVYIKAIGDIQNSSSDLNFGARSVTVGPNTPTFWNWALTSSTKLPEHVTDKLYIKFDVECWICDGSKSYCDQLTPTWSSRGSTDYIPLYLLWKAPLSGSATYNYHSVFEIACSGGGNSENTIFSNVWNKFASRSVSTHAGVPLQYYPYGNCSLPYTFYGFLLTNKGQCHNFTQLIIYALGLNGIQRDGRLFQTRGVPYYPPDETLVLHNLYPGSSGGSPPYPYYMLFPSEGYSMCPWNSWYGDMYNNSGSPGQNVSDPAQKVFYNHSVVEHNGQGYDPSYGKVYASSSAFENTSVYGFGGWGRTAIGNGTSDLYVREQDNQTLETHSYTYYITQ